MFALLVAGACSRATTADPGLIRWDRRQQLIGATVPVFHPVTECTTALLRIGRVSGRYGKQGMLRVAWRREAVFDDFTLQVIDSTDWPRIAAAVVRTVEELGRAELVHITRFSLRQSDGAQVEVTADSASLLPGGDLRLRGVVIRRAPDPELRLGEYTLRLSVPGDDPAALLPTAPAAAR